MIFFLVICPSPRHVAGGAAVVNTVGVTVGVVLEVEDVEEVEEVEEVDEIVDKLIVDELFTSVVVDTMGAVVCTVGVVVGEAGVVACAEERARTDATSASTSAFMAYGVA